MMTRAEHLAWAKERALVYADQGDGANAMSSLAVDLMQHPELAQHPGINLMMMELMIGGLRTPHDIRHTVEGFR